MSLEFPLFNYLRQDLQRIGYRSRQLPKPLRELAAECAHYTGPLFGKSKERSWDFGQVDIVTRGANYGDPVVIHLPGRGDYHGIYQEDLFLAHGVTGGKGKLLLVKDFYLFCGFEARDTIAQSIADIRRYRTQFHHGSRK